MKRRCVLLIYDTIKWSVISIREVVVIYRPTVSTVPLSKSMDHPLPHPLKKKKEKEKKKHS